MALTEGAAVDLFCRMRWPNGVACPQCEAAKPYRHKKRHLVYVCRQCARQFTPTSGTALHGRKLSYPDLIRLLRKLIVSDGESLLSLSRGANYKTIYVTAQKLKAEIASGDGDRFRGYWQGKAAT